ncbi:MAG: PAS domain-containing protein [Pseudomonadota bacterium]
MQTETSSRLFTYWNDLRGPRMAPNRFEIEPARIADLLSRTFILERDAAEQFVFRLAGTLICERFGREFRGANILSLLTQTDCASLERVLKSVTHESAVGVVTLDASTGDGRITPLEMLILPLIHDGSTVSRLLGALATIGEPPAWLGHTPIAQTSVTRVSMIWPDGHPHALIDGAARQLPFSQIQGPKRVVSIDRRRFRVFDGGRDAAQNAEPSRGSDRRVPPGERR